MAASLSERFEAVLLERNLLNPGDKVFVACSGGPDSAALFRLLFDLRKKWRLRLGLLHLNHGLRGRESAGDTRFVCSLARRAKLPVYSTRKDVKRLARLEKLSVEEAARKVRYGFFTETASRYRIPKIALAHTLNDQAETVLMRVMQGTGLRGLMGIRESFRQGKALFIRPLLFFTRREIMEYLKKEKIAYRIDSSNDSERFLRNRIRKKLLPLMEREFNPRILNALARIPASLAEDNEALEKSEEEAFRKLKKGFRRGRFKVDRLFFSGLSQGIQFRLLNRMLGTLDSQSGINFENWQGLKGHFLRKRSCCSLKRDIDISLTPVQIIIYKKKGRG